MAAEISMITNTALTTKDASFLNICPICERFSSIQGGALTHTSNKDKNWLWASRFTA